MKVSAGRFLALSLAVVICTDQVTKWWAWRHLSGSLVNGGGYLLLGPTVRGWYAGRVTGTVADIGGGLLLISAFRWLLGRPRSRSAVVGATLIGAGLVSNLLDRLMLHYWTAPGSVRGAVDFIPSGGPSRSNVADLWIVLGALVLCWATVRGRWSGAPAAGASWLVVAHRHRLSARLLGAVLVAGLIGCAVFGADHPGVLQSTQSLRR